MSAKTIFYQDSSRKVFEKGMDVLAETVAVTLGPKGKNIVLGKKFGTPQVINDGVSIAKELDLVDNIGNVGVCLIRQAALKTNDVAGDGTTTSTVLAFSIIRQGMRNVGSGANPIILKRGIEKAAHFVIDGLNEFSRSIRGESDIVNVSLIASGNDREVSLLIKDVYAEIGREGLIFVEEGKARGTEVQIKKGMTFDKGFISGYFVTDQKRMVAELGPAYILITDRRITKVKTELLPTLELIATNPKPLLILSEDVQKEALATLILNKMRGIMEVVAVKAPGFGDRRRAFLSDLALLTGGKVISSDSGFNLQNIDRDSLGQARKIVVGKESTTIISDENKREVFARCEQLRRTIETSDYTYEKEKIQERLSRLSSGLAIIRVGAPTIPEIKDRRLRLEDAVCATRAALEEGIVPGGGAALAHFSEKLLEWAHNNLFGEELIGALIMQKSLNAPLKKIVSNAGINETVLIKRVKEASFELGYNVATNDVTDLYVDGIVDPVRVTRSALQNAASIASMVLTTECLIVNRLN